MVGVYNYQKQCTIKDCTLPVYCKERCRKHDAQRRREDTLFRIKGVEAVRRYKSKNRERLNEESVVRRRNRRQYLAELKLSIGCFDCGYTGSSDALEFDHVRGEKLFNIASGIGRPWSELDAEIRKCEVVCANCHRSRTAARR